MTRLIFAVLHLLGLGIGLGAIWCRMVALRGPAPLDPAALRRVFLADAFWGIAALIWISTGLVRVLSGLEKGTDWYLSQPVFHAKMGFLVLILILEIKPMITLNRWRGQLGKGTTIDSSAAPALARISLIQAVLVVAMVVAAAALARGVWAKA